MKFIYMLWALPWGHYTLYKAQNNYHLGRIEEAASFLLNERLCGFVFCVLSLQPSIPQMQRRLLLRFRMGPYRKSAAGNCVYPLSPQRSMPVRVMWFRSKKRFPNSNKRIRTRKGRKWEMKKEDKRREKRYLVFQSIAVSCNSCSPLKSSKFKASKSLTSLCFSIWLRITCLIVLNE